MNKTFKLAAISAFVILAGGVSVAHAETTGQYVDDTAITTKVKAALLADSRLKAMHISVETNQGSVELSGTVDNKSQESEAIKVANQVEGVKLVKDIMTVRGTQEQ